MSHPSLENIGIHTDLLLIRYEKSRPGLEKARIPFLAESLVLPYLDWLDDVVSQKGHAWDLRAQKFASIVSEAGYLVTEMSIHDDGLRARRGLSVLVHNMNADMKSLRLPGKLNELIKGGGYRTTTLIETSMTSRFSLPIYYLDIE